MNTQPASARHKVCKHLHAQLERGHQQQQLGALQVLGEQVGGVVQPGERGHHERRSLACGADARARVCGLCMWRWSHGGRVCCGCARSRRQRQRQRQRRWQRAQGSTSARAPEPVSDAITQSEPDRMTGAARRCTSACVIVCGRARCVCVWAPRVVLCGRQQAAAGRHGAAARDAGQRPAPPLCSAAAPAASAARARRTCAPVGIMRPRRSALSASHSGTPSARQSSGCACASALPASASLACSRSLMLSVGRVRAACVGACWWLCAGVCGTRGAHHQQPAA
jgi:hypothetical protein